MCLEPRYDSVCTWLYRTSTCSPLRVHVAALCTGAECVAEVVDDRYCETDHFGKVTVQFDHETKLPRSLQIDHVTSEGRLHGSQNFELVLHLGN